MFPPLKKKKKKKKPQTEENFHLGLKKLHILLCVSY